MFGFLRPVIWRAVWACFVTVLMIVIEACTLNQAGLVTSQLKDFVNAPSRGIGLSQWITSNDWLVIAFRMSLVIFAISAVGLLVARYLLEMARILWSMNMVFFIRAAVYDKLQRVGFAFHDRISTGQLINRALSDLQNVRQFVQSSLMQSIEIAATLFVYLGVIFVKNPWIALIALVPLPFWTLYTIHFSRRAQPAARSVMEAADRNIGLITENIVGVHVVKAFATEKDETRRYNESCEDFMARVIRRIRLTANFTPVIRAIATASHLLMFLFTALFIIWHRNESLKLGDILVLSGAMGIILLRLQNIALIAEQYQDAMVSARRLYEVINASPTVPEKPNAIDLPKDGRGEVKFENVTFGYSKEKPVLCSLSFAVPAGAIVAIVGPTGAGKSSMVSLIARFYDPDEGRITIDGTDLRDVKLGSLRTQVSFVFQETFLFSASVTQNIAYGRPDISPGEVESAARFAQAHEFIEKLPQGYDTLLGERGTNLSGGQRQRLAIARAILTNPRVLILDDATAAVDSETEDLIRRGMKFVMRGRTTFIIAHRISTVKQADLVMVIQGGRITQMGRHDELMLADGHYRAVARAQLALDEEDDRFATRPEDPSHIKRARDAEKISQAQEEARVKQQSAATDEV